MPAIQINFGDIEEFEPLTPGNYPVMVEHVELRTSKSDPDSQYLNWELIVSDGEYLNRHLFFMTSLKPKALWRLKVVLLAIGAYSDEWNIEVDDDTNLVLNPQLNGLPGTAVVKNEVYDGRLRDRVDDLLAPMEEFASSAAPVAPIAPVAPVRPPAPTPAPVARPAPATAPTRQGPPPIATRPSAPATAPAARPKLK